MDLSKLNIAILVANGFEESELLSPKKALEAAGAKVTIVSPEKDQVKSWTQINWGNKFSIDLALDEADTDHFDGLILPGGVINPDTLRINEKAINFIKSFVKQNKPICAICHGPWTLINADGVKGRKMTSWASLEKDLTNAGATWVNEACVWDKNLITSRKPEDLPEFNKNMLSLFSQIKTTVNV